MRRAGQEERRDRTTGEDQVAHEEDGAECQAEGQGAPAGGRRKLPESHGQDQQSDGDEGVLGQESRAQRRDSRQGRAERFGGEAGLDFDVETGRPHGVEPALGERLGDENTRCHRRARLVRSRLPARTVTTRALPVELEHFGQSALDQSSAFFVIVFVPSADQESLLEGGLAIFAEEDVNSLRVR